MERFYLIVTAIAILVLILVLIFVGILMKTTKNKVVFPSSQSMCPELWNINSDNTRCIFDGSNNYGSYAVDSITKLITIPSGDTYITNVPTSGITPAYSYIDLTSSNWTTTGSSDICGKSNWANKNGIEWAGIKEYNNC